MDKILRAWNDLTIEQQEDIRDEYSDLYYAVMNEMDKQIRYERYIMETQIAIDLTC